MLQVKSQEASSTILLEEYALKWHEITGKELEIVVKEDGTTHNINLEIKQEGRKTSTVALNLVSVDVPEEVVAKYADDPLLEKTIATFAAEQYRDLIEMISRFISNAYESNHIVNLTGVKSVEIQIALRVDRDEDSDEVIGESITATVGERKFVYSNAGVFDEA